MALLLPISFLLDPCRLILTPSRSRENPRFRRFPPISASSSSSSSWEREEARWLREEQRWVREEQRWIREEQRWNSEKESLLREIAALKLRNEALESTDDKVAVLESVLRVLKDRAVESGSRSPPPTPKLALIEDAVVKELIMEEIKDPKGEDVILSKDKGRKTNRMALRKGSEGDDVRAMQEALQALGFYSGEEDMEYSSFSSGTECAVKTWQASLGFPEDGIMNSELLDKLFGRDSYKENNDQEGDVASKEKGSANGAAVASATEITEIKQTVVQSDRNKEMKSSEHRVFLLGENRWEEPARLGNKDNLIDGRKSQNVSTTKCLSCRGEGRLMCTECDGTGEPNIEPQFLEWVDEGTKCPYCEGLGYTICDVCEGKNLSQN